jgi:hypothetical protein
MARVVLAPALARWLSSDTGAAVGGEVAVDVSGADLGEVMDGLFVLHPRLRGYVLDEQGALRHHVAVFVDGQVVRDKHRPKQPLDDDAEVYVTQALSGG